MLQSSSNLNFYPPPVENFLLARASEFERHIVTPVAIRFRRTDIGIFAVKSVGWISRERVSQCVDAFNSRLRSHGNRLNQMCRAGASVRADWGRPRRSPFGIPVSAFALDGVMF